jgi:hypothetical protein
MENKHWKTGPVSAFEQLRLFEPEAAISILALHRFRCPEVPMEFFYPRLFNPNKPIVDNHDDTFDHLKCEVIDFPETPCFPEAA